MSRVVWESVTLAGRVERARAARAFVSEVLGSGHPCRDSAILLVSEIFSNSVRHSGSGAPGETVTVAIISGDGVVRVEVTDRAGWGRRSCVLRGVRRKTGAGFRSLRALRRGGAGGGAASGW
jgi:anti-sigma regulatory factor (Ser/Thr protein kinase)